MAIVTTAEAKAFLDVEHADDDTLIADLVAGCQAAIEQAMGGRKIEQAAFTETFDGGSTIFFLRNRPIAASPAPVVKDTGVAIDSALYKIYAEGGYVRGTFAEGDQRWTVEYTGGWASGSVPVDLKQAVKMLVAYRYAQRVPGLARSRDADSDAWDAGSTLEGGNGMPRQVMNLISKYRTPV